MLVHGVRPKGTLVALDLVYGSRPWDWGLSRCAELVRNPRELETSVPTNTCARTPVRESGCEGG